MWRRLFMAACCVFLPFASSHAGSFDGIWSVFRSLQFNKGRSSGIHVALRRDREGWPSGWAIPVKGTESIADIGGANQTRRYRFAQCGRYLGGIRITISASLHPKPGSRFASLPSSNQRRERAAGRAFAPASLHLASIDHLYSPIGSSKRVADEGCPSESALRGVPARQRLESCRMSALGHLRRFFDVRDMSGLPQIADISGPGRPFAFVPAADIILH